MTIPNFRSLCLIVVTFAVVYGGANWLFNESYRAEALLKKKGVNVIHDERDQVISLAAEGIDLSDADMKMIARFRSIKYLTLRRTKLTRNGIEQLRTATKLLALDLSHSTLTDDALDAVFQLSMLKGLQLTGCPWLTDKHLVGMVALKNLERLELSSPQITSAGVSHFSQLPALRELVMSECAGIDDDAVEQFASLTQLIQLTLSGTELTSQGYCQLHQRLPRVRLSSPVVTLKDLREISTRGGFSVDPSGAISGFYQDWDRSDVKRSLLPGDLTVIGKLTELRTIELQGDVTDQMLLELGPQPQLDRLSLRDTLITDDGLSVLANFSNLTTLDLIRAKGIEGHGLRHLSYLAKLKRLMANVQSDEGVWEALAPLSQLETLFITAPMTDAGMANLQGLSKLTRIDATGGKLTGPGLASLARLPNLTNLYYSGTGTLQDEPFIECVSQLKSLRTIELYQSGVTLEACQRLRKLRPDLSVMWHDSESRKWIKLE